MRDNVTGLDHRIRNILTRLPWTYVVNCRWLSYLRLAVINKRVTFGFVDQTDVVVARSTKITLWIKYLVSSHDITTVLSVRLLHVQLVLARFDLRSQLGHKLLVVPLFTFRHTRLHTVLHQLEDLRPYNNLWLLRC